MGNVLHLREGGGAQPWAWMADKAVYKKICQIAHNLRTTWGSRLEQETIDLVNEGYLRIRERYRSCVLTGPEFTALISRVIRNLCVDTAREGVRHPAAAPVEDAKPQPEEDCIRRARERSLDVHAGLLAMEAEDPRGKRLRCVVELRFWASLVEQEIAEALDVSLRTVERDWAYAKAWLREWLESEGRHRSRSPAPPREAGMPRPHRSMDSLPGGG